LRSATASRLPVRTGLEVLQARDFAPLRGRRVGLLTNQTGRTARGESAIDLLFRAPGVKLVALFSPEHGIRGAVDAKVPSSRDDRTGLPIWSLYGKMRRPTRAMLEGIDTIVVDLQDAGARFYTYMSTMGYLMEEAAKRGIGVVVLDRPNPITGRIEGPMLDPDLRGFTGYFPMPVRHGLTLGELAGLFNVEGRIGVDLTVIELENWHRDAWFDETGLPWVNPSPNLRNLIAATLYPGIGGIEGSRLSVGRGTDTPFEQVGAPWIDGAALAGALNARGLAGVRFYPVTFTPASGPFAGELCGGVFLLVTDRERLRPVRVGLELAAAVQRLYPAQYQLEAAREPILGSRAVQRRVAAGEDPGWIAADWAAGERGWEALSGRYRLYR
jgi:uncharacterized protein YbbC (DUF1343 family)